MKKQLIWITALLLALHGFCEEPAWRFVSMPDFLNVDTDYPQPGWEDSLSYILESVKAENPDFLVVPGDLVMGHWHNNEVEQGLPGIKHFAEIYYPAWKARLKAHGLKWYAAVGDHELGDNPWDYEGAQENVAAYRQAFREYLDMPLNGPEHMQGTAFWWRHKNVLFLSVDVFEEGQSDQGSIRTGVTGKQLDWMKRVLEENGDAKHKVVIGHAPCLGPVRKWSTSGLMDSVWPRMKALHLNTLIAPISWQAVEPVEGEFDFSLVDGLIAQAREQDMKLSILWFGTWKNARSFFVPAWVISDMERFPRMENKNGQRIEYISSFSENAKAADAKAFAAFMRHLKAVDGTENTVVMVQIQNEVGLLGDTRDRSPQAQRAFEQPVPQKLIDYMVSNKDQLKPHLKRIWALNGHKTVGTWSEVFGSGIEADEIFMAWHYARYIDHMAAAGKAEHNLPMFVNGWLGQVKHGTPGKYPSGGPVARMMDVWKAGGPNIDLLAGDIYAYYKFRCENFTRDDNPLFVPEACALWLGDRWSGPAKAFYTIAEAQAIGFSPFGIDHAYYDADHPLGVAYKTLNNLMPLILKNYGTENLRGFYKAVEEGKPEETGTSITIGPYTFDVLYESKKLDDCYGLIMRTAENEFIIAGNGIRVRFEPADANAHPGVSICSIEEGSLDENGEWVRKRLAGGGETMGANGTKLPLLGFWMLHDKNNMSIQRIQLYLHPPRKDGKSVYKTDTAPEF